MYQTNFRKYVEGLDVSKVSPDTITFPSKNAIIYKGIIFTRPGIENDGTPATNTNKITGEDVWKDQFYSPKFVRVEKGGQMSTKIVVANKESWIPIFSGIDPDAENVRFETQLDNTQTLTALTKKRLFFVDGTEDIHEWNGAIGTIDSIAGAVIMLSENTTPQGLGFDRGDVGGAKAVLIARFDVDGNYLGQEEYAYSENGNTPGTLTLDSSPAPVPNHGDLILAKPITRASVYAGFTIDDIYTYKNHVGIANFKSAILHFSDALQILDYTIPAPGSTTALSAFDVPIDGFYTAMSSRDNILWISSPDDWWTVNSLLDPNAAGTYVDIKKFDQPERNGALPYAISKYNKDLLFISQTKKVRQVTTQQLTGKDDIVLISDDVELMMNRLNLDNCRIYYQNRYAFIPVPFESQLLMIDMLGNPQLEISYAWMPPQTVPVGLMSFWQGVQYGHSNCDNQTFTVFSGRSDLGTDITSVIAFGYIGSADRHKLNKFTEFGLNGRANLATKIEVAHFWESDGATQLGITPIDMEKIKTFSVLDDLSWAIWPWAFRSLAGSDMENSALKRFFAFDKQNASSWFEYRPVITVTGKENEFHLIGWGLDNAESPNKKSSALYITK